MSPEATLDISHLSGVYKTYHNEEYGFTFEYPAVFDDGPYPGACALYEDSNGSYPALYHVYVGHRTWISVVDAEGMSLSEYLDEFIASGQRMAEEDSDIIFMVTPLVFSEEENGQIFTDENGNQYVTLEYRFGLTNRYGRITIFSHDGYFIEIDFTAGLFCDFPEIDIYETRASLKILESFMLLP